MYGAFVSPSLPSPEVSALSEGGETSVTITPPSWRSIDWDEYLHEATVCGATLRYVDYGEGPPLLAVHGMGGSWESWLSNIPELGGHYRVIAVDLPGFGGSEALAAGAGFNAYLDSLAGLLDEIGIPEVVLLGHSLGGLVALSFAAAYPDRCLGLVLASGGGTVLGRLRLTAIQAVFWILQKVFAVPGVRSLFVKTSLGTLMLAVAVRHPRRISRDLLDQMLPRTVGPGFMTAVRLGSEQLHRLNVRHVVVPVLLIWGREDRLLPLAGGRDLAAQLPRAELVVLDDVGHCAMFEAPDDFNDAAQRFLAAHPFGEHPRAGDEAG